MAEPLRHRQTKEAATDMFSLQPPRHISTLPFATGPSPHPVELCLLCPQKRKPNQGLGICHDGLWRVDDAATSFNAQAFSNSPSGNLA